MVTLSADLIERELASLVQMLQKKELPGRDRDRYRQVRISSGNQALTTCAFVGTDSHNLLERCRDRAA